MRVPAEKPHGNAVDGGFGRRRLQLSDAKQRVAPAKTFVSCERRQTTQLDCVGARAVIRPRKYLPETWHDGDRPMPVVARNVIYVPRLEFVHQVHDAIIADAAAASADQKDDTVAATTAVRLA